MEKEVLGQRDVLKKKYKANRISKSNMEKETSQLSDRYMHDLAAMLNVIEFKERCWCVVHEDWCFVSPRSAEEFELHWWLEGAGTTCTASSLMGLRLKWLDSSALVLMVWIYSTRYYSPDFILHECTKTFPHEVLMNALNEELGMQPKCIFPKAAGAAEFAL